MNYTLDNFYQSHEWVNLTHILRNERLDKDGNLVCWYCGKPIIKKYDAIAHHTIFLTDDNVNIVDISLNPELIRFVHHRCHNIIHEKLGSIKREIYLVYGPPLAGKKSFVDRARGEGDLLIDLDLIWMCITGSRDLRKPPRLNSVAFGVRDYLMDCVTCRRGKWNNAYIVGGFPLSSERERICRKTGAREIYVECSKEESMERLEQTDDRDKKEWAAYIDQWWARYQGNTLPPTPHENFSQGKLS